jgi:hypothetical protein
MNGKNMMANVMIGIVWPWINGQTHGGEFAKVSGQE